MDTKPIGGQFAPSEQMVLTDLTGAELHRARLVVCANAHDREDARELLECLGLIGADDA